MDLVSEIIRKFFEKLSADTEIPKSLIIELRSLWEKGNLKSKPSVINSIKSVIGENHED